MSVLTEAMVPADCNAIGFNRSTLVRDQSPPRKAQADYENDPGQGTGVGAGVFAPDRIGNAPVSDSTE